jgi:hypothetical protein
VEAIMKWLRRTTGITPCAVMSDCALAIRKDITAAYSDLGSQAPKVYWCIFHVIRAFKKKAKDFLQDRAEEAVTDFRKVLYNEQYVEIRIEELYEKWAPVNENFVNYVKSQWHTNIVNWAMAYRLVSHYTLNSSFASYPPNPFRTLTCSFSRHLIRASTLIIIPKLGTEYSNRTSSTHRNGDV